MPTIHTSHERARCCGFRKKGLYLMADKPSVCHMFPVPTAPCKCCGMENKPRIAISLFPTRFLFPDPPTCTRKEAGDPDTPCCGFVDEIMSQERYAVDWVGAKNYPNPGDFLKEAAVMGISRRIAKLPDEFKVGSDKVIIAHAKTFDGKPGYIGTYTPTHIEYVVGGDETQEELEAMEDKGVRLVEVYQLHDEQLSMFSDPEDMVTMEDHMSSESVDSMGRYLSNEYGRKFTEMNTIISDKLGRGEHVRLASAIYGMLVEQGHGTIMANRFKKYTQLRVDRYRLDLKKQ